jgi:hypothetical protein
MAAISAMKDKLRMQILPWSADDRGALARLFSRHTYSSASGGQKIDKTLGEQRLADEPIYRRL